MEEERRSIEWFISGSKRSKKRIRVTELLLPFALIRRKDEREREREFSVGKYKGELYCAAGVEKGDTYSRSANGVTKKRRYNRY